MMAAYIQLVFGTPNVVIEIYGVGNKTFLQKSGGGHQQANRRKEGKT
jgi:hypothetical protein